MDKNKMRKKFKLRIKKPRNGKGVISKPFE